MNAPPADPAGPAVSGGDWGLRPVFAGLGIGWATTVLVQLAVMAAGGFEVGDDLPLEAVSYTHLTLPTICSV